MASPHPGAVVLILGAGVGGLVAARRLRRSLPARHRVILVEREERYVFQPSLLWLMTGDRTEASISRPVGSLARHGIEVVRGEIEEIDPTRRTVRVAGTTIAADYIIVSLGASLVPEKVPGLDQAGVTFYTSAGARAVASALSSFEGGRIALLTAAPAYKCPAAPYEAAMLVEAFLRKRGLRSKTEIEFYAAEPGPMGVAGPEVSAAVRGMVERKGINYHPQHQIESVDAERRTLSFANGLRAPFDLLIHVPPHGAPQVVRDAGLVGDAGWIPVDRHRLSTTFERVLAIGDVATIPLSLGKPLPKAGVFAHAQAEVVARNVSNEILGRAQVASFDGRGDCFVETGDGRAGFGGGNFFAEPAPTVTLRDPSRGWHLAKIAFEKAWLWRWF